MKRFSLVFCLVVALSLVFVGSAFANFGPHGGYATDTDSCAGCHRAHTSFSTVEFTPAVPGPGGNVNALLVGSASTMLEFCYACHGDSAPGAATNVQSGVFDAGPSTAGMLPATASQPYQTASAFGKPLNGGGFTQAAKNWDWEVSATAAYAAVTSAHSMETSSVLWGAGNGSNQSTYLICTSCHDPHGSSNFRLLKDTVNGVAVGGYNSINAVGGTAPDGWVFSTETGYPTAAEGGWMKGPDGAAQMAAYKPDYTGGTPIAANVASDPGASLSGWCSACHTGYNNQTSVKDYGSYESTVGAQARHRHPVDMALSSGDAIIQTPAMQYVADPRIPLEAVAGAADFRSDQVGCLTCHLAHGSSQDMTGWAAASLVRNGADTMWVPEIDNIAGVNPDKSDLPGTTNTGFTGTSSLLRADNRGVCERCHNK